MFDVESESPSGTSTSATPPSWIWANTFVTSDLPSTSWKTCRAQPTVLTMTSSTECNAVHISLCVFAEIVVEDELQVVFNESYRSCKARVRCFKKTSRESVNGKESSRCKVSSEEHKLCQDESVTQQKSAMSPLQEFT